MNKLILLLLAVLTASCDSRSVAKLEEPAVVEPAQARLAFTRDLVSTINRSEKIIFTEHSFRGDLIGGAANVYVVPDKIIYETRELTSIQKAAFISAIEEMDATLQEAMSKEINIFGPAEAMAPCMFAPHHTITFVAQDRTLSTMEVSFVCGRVEWDAYKSGTPNAFAAMLYKFVGFIGLHPDRDWEQLAKDTLVK